MHIHNAQLPDISGYTPLELAACIKSGEISPLLAVEAAIQAVERLDPKYHFISLPLFEQARAQAAAMTDLRAPFAGVPMVVKDLLDDIEGVPTGSGNCLLRYVRAARTCDYIRGLHRAGFIPIAKAACPEFGILPITASVNGVLQPTGSAYNSEFNAGGSSGGSACAVALGCVPFATGGDGGGSLRVPASLNGLVTVMPSGHDPLLDADPSGSAYLIPTNGQVYWGGFARKGGFSRDTESLATVYDQFRDERLWPRSFRDAARNPGQRQLRIAYTTKPLFSTRPMDPECVSVLLSTVDRLKLKGHVVEGAAPGFDAKQAALNFVTVLAGDVHDDVVHAAHSAGLPVDHRNYGYLAYLLYLVGRGIKAGQREAALGWFRELRKQTDPFFEKYDVLLMPTVAKPRLAHDQGLPKGIQRWVLEQVCQHDAGWFLRATGAIGQLAADSFESIPCTPFANATRRPAANLPVGWTADGSPIGVQAVAGFRREDVLFGLLAECEADSQLGWRHRRPVLNDRQAKSA